MSLYSLYKGVSLCCILEGRERKNGVGSKVKCGVKGHYPLTEALGSCMAFKKVLASLVVFRMVSVLPSLNMRVPPLSYMGAMQPYILGGHGSKVRGCVVVCWVSLLPVEREEDCVLDESVGRELQRFWKVFAVL